MRALRAPFILPISQKPIPDGVVVIEDGRIVDVGPAAKLLSEYPSAEREDYSHAVLMPGLVNAHTHLDLMNFDGKTASGESLEFFDWLTLGWNHRRSLTPAGRRQCFDDGIRQLLRSGTTCVGDAGQY
ncbi:MAG TPA: amidohydrolase family protein, partial [bacterium]|nr:amidohydrolase family protein [bacterium]